MNNSEVFVEITTEGEVEISVKGAKGSDCHDLTRNIENALGTISKTSPTREAKETTSVNHQQRTTN